MSAIGGALKRKKSHTISCAVAEFFTNPLNPKVVGAYAPMPNEVDWTIEWPATEELRLCFPALRGTDMNFFSATLEELEVSQDFGVALPTPKKSASTVTPDALLIPGIAFTESGKRLGRGGGHYDKYLASFTGLKIGLCFEEQVVEDLPVCPHDIPVNGIITDRRQIWI